jgi:membrane protein YfhO
MPSRGNYAVLESPVGAEADAIALLERAIAADHISGEYPRVEVLGLGGPWQNLAMVRGWEAINGYNPLRIGLYDRLVAPGEENWDVSHRRFPPSFASYDSPLARALGLTYLVLGQPLDEIPALSKPPLAELLLAGPPIWIYRVADAVPRALLETDITISGRSSQSLSPEKPSSVKIDSVRPGHIELVTASVTDCLLVLHQNYFPGWVAEVDGQMAPIRRTDRLFLAVDLPAGGHRVVLRFLPLSLANLFAAFGVEADKVDAP